MTRVPLKGVSMTMKCTGSQNNLYGHAEDDLAP
jgi:hypothetical protein